MPHHHLKASAETCHWGFFDAALPPVLTVASGDTVTIDTVTGPPEMQPAPGSGLNVLPEIAEIHARAPKQLPGHILTGPVAVEGAEPGDVLQVDILEVTPRTNWGYNVIRPLAGTCNPISTRRASCISRWISMRTQRRCPSASPWSEALFRRDGHGTAAGLGARHLHRAARLWRQSRQQGADGRRDHLPPCFTKGGGFSCGDGHGAQGDGEVCVTAIETALQGKFRFTLRKDLNFCYPRAETPTHYLTMGMDPDLDRCAEMALRDMIVLSARKARALPRGCLYPLLAGRRFARHPDREWLEGHPLRHRKAASRLIGISHESRPCGTSRPRHRRQPGYRPGFGHGARAGGREARAGRARRGGTREGVRSLARAGATSSPSRPISRKPVQRPPSRKKPLRRWVGSIALWRMPAAVSAPAR